MADRNKRLLGPLALVAGLAGGAAAGVVLGTPGVSGAQTTTAAPSGPTTTVPGSTAQPDQPAYDGKHCPDKDGSGTPAPATGSSTGAATNASAGFRGRGGPGV